jgi:hypothetical protein
MQELFKLSISVIGIKKRCRKVEKHFFDAGYIPYSEEILNQDELIDKARNLVNTNMKTVQGVPVLRLNHVTESEGIIQWEMFSAKHKEIKILEPVLQELI